MADASTKGQIPLGERHGEAKLRAEDIHAIRQRYMTGEVQPALAADFGVSNAQISRIIRGEEWGHLHTPGFVYTGNRRIKLTLEQRADIRTRYPYTSLKALAAEHSTDEKQIWRVATGRN